MSNRKLILDKYSNAIGLLEKIIANYPEILEKVKDSSPEEESVRAIRRDIL